MSRNIMPGKRNTRIVAFPHLAVSITAESDALAAATTANWLDVQGWRTDLDVPQGGNLTTVDEQWFNGYPQFELMIEADATETITASELYAVRLGPVTIADDTFTATGSDAVLTATTHSMLTGDGPFYLSNAGGALPSPLAVDTPYWVEKTGASTFELYTSRALAIAAGTGIVTTDAGTGTQTIADKKDAVNEDDNTRRCRFTLLGRLNSGAATIGTIVVGVQTAYMERINHSPLDLYYMLVATETSAQTLTVRVTPVMEIFE